MIRIDKKTYPNGQDYKVIAVFNNPTDKWNIHTIGTYDIKGSGFLPSGNKKIIQNEDDAIDIVCRKYIERHNNFIEQAKSFMRNPNF